MYTVSVPSNQWDAIARYAAELYRATDEWHKYEPPPDYKELAKELAEAVKVLRKSNYGYAEFGDEAPYEELEARAFRSLGL